MIPKLTSHEALNTFNCTGTKKIKRNCHAKMFVDMWSLFFFTIVVILLCVPVVRYFRFQLNLTGSMKRSSVQRKKEKCKQKQ